MQRFGRLSGGRITAAQKLAKFVAKYEPGIVQQAKQALVKLRQRTPGAIETVYDNWNGLVIGSCPNEEPSLAILSILMAPDHLSLCILCKARACLLLENGCRVLEMWYGTCGWPDWKHWTSPKFRN